jgi:hypothetical protein
MLRQICIVALAMLAGHVFPAPSEAQSSRGLGPAEKLKLLLAAYPGTLARAQGNDILFKNGTRLPFDDGKGGKSFETLLASPDIEDMFAIGYPLGQLQPVPPLNSDPGRIRNTAFFQAMYGDCSKGEVSRNLVDVVWLPKRSGTRIKMTRINGVAERLAAVSAELDALPERFLKFLVPAAGTYNCRAIAGTERASAHGFGIAIDLSVAHAHYWRWTKPAADGRYPFRNAIPAEIVAVFEKHGFIWGGKWYHYDTMHFEYRPEILAAARLCGAPCLHPPAPAR